MSDLIIHATTNTSQTGVIITDKTDWDTMPTPLFGIDNMAVNLYQTSLTTPVKVHQLTSTELASFKANGFIELSFITLNSTIYLNDDWWTVKMTANGGYHESNFSGFGIYADITHAVFSQINNLHVPEEIKYTAEKYCIMAMWRQGLKFLDTTSVNAREIKFRKRLASLQKMLLNL
jgi:hypothetical protein